ncbi:MAG: electron transfer flavoprotein subunit alpha/FixB family protein [Acidobacteriota bacterium]|nr:electron transfer flavoprotein subunit alpha/FixB family protein [Acidobacteriota bacterium]
MSKKILVIAEHEEGRIRRGSLEALAAARKLAQAWGGQVIGAVLAEQAGDLAEDFARKGADEVVALEHPALARYTPDGYRQAIAGLIAEIGPEWVLMAHTYLAQDMLPLVSSATGAPVLSDCVGVELDGERAIFLRQPYDAKFVARTVDNGPAPHFATLQSGAFPADELPESPDTTVTTRTAAIDEAALRRKVLAVREVGDRTVDLSASEVVVAGGRGLGSKEKFEELVGSLASALGAAIGASRPVVDSEWLPHAHQIGSSGQAITPKLYVALGISGAIQHVVGIRGAQCIVAINRDKEAPIFNEATYGIVGDVAEVVPALVTAIEEAKAQ